uniref:Uncharacterized protein n=1 Tax=Tetranychus urticae TaxID=32264 RepID=T1KEV7_TETUR
MVVFTVEPTLFGSAYVTCTQNFIGPGCRNELRNRCEAKGSSSVRQANNFQRYAEAIDSSNQIRISVLQLLSKIS